MAIVEDPSEQGSGSGSSGTSEAPAAAEEASRRPVLPDDVIFAILLLLPDFVALFRCSVVCKTWRRMLTSAAFLNTRTWPDGSRPSLLGYFAQRHRIGGGGSSRRRKISRLFPTLAPALIPSPGSHLGPERRFLNSFFRDDAGVLDDAKPLAARGGLLLVLVRAPPPPPPASSSRGRNGGGSSSLLRLCVCNMYTGRLDLLPPLDAGFLDGDGVKGYGLVTAADHGDAGAPHRPTEGYNTFFQVLLVGVAREERQLHLIRFSSSAAAAAGDSGTMWCSHNCSQLTGVALRGPYGCCIASVNVATGTAHWLFHGNDAVVPSLYTLDVSISTWNISATLLTFDDGLPVIFREALSHAWLGTSLDPRLMLVYVRNNNLAIWAQRNEDQQVGNAGWGLAHVVHIDDVEPGLFGTESLTPVCMGENSGTVLALYPSNPECAYVINLQSGAATKLEGWTRSFNYMTAVPYEINWPLFFLCRLGLRPYMLGAA